MILLNIKIAWRNIWRNKVFSSINIIGLALSMAACLAVSMYVWNEMQFDRFHKNAKNIYRITNKQNQSGQWYQVAVTPGPLAPALQKDFPEINKTVRFGNWGGLVKVGNKIYNENNVQLTENSVFNLFNFPLEKGDAKTALLAPDDIVISASTAEKYFGDDWQKNAELLGSSIILNGTTFKLAGVAKNVPAQSSIQFDILLPLAYVFKTDEWSNKWGSNNYHTYVQLKPNTNVAAFESKLAKQLKVYKPNTEDLLQLQPLLKQYLYSNFDFFSDWGKRSDIKYVQIFFAVGLLLLLIACVNFVNLSTARSLKRSLEVGVRKVNGATRRQLVFQFLSESFVITTIAAFIALFILQWSAPLVESMTGVALSLSITNGVFLTAFLLFILVVALLAGMYPAFIMSSFKAIQVLKGKAAVNNNAQIRKGLVVFQFAVSVSLMICTFFMYRQLQFVQSKDLGFNDEQIIQVALGNELKGKVSLLKNELENEPTIVATAPATMSLANVDNSGNMEWDGMQADASFLITQANVDPDFISTLGMKIVSGENFRWQKVEDTVNYYMVNETAVKMMGMTPDNVIGKQATFWGAKGQIIGVVKDFHFKPMSAGIEPFIFRYQPWASYFHLFVKTLPGKTEEAINQIKKAYKKFEPESPFSFSFLNESINSLYKEDQRTASIILLFTCLTIFVGCLGLFGLTVFAAELRIKEIGIRKVLGASVISVAQLIAKDFLKLIAMAILIAIPAAWYASSMWLQQYVYRIQINGWVFAFASATVMAIAIITISFYAIKAASANPIKSLRTE